MQPLAPVIFISHHGKDAEIADALADLLQNSIVGLRPTEIFCTTPRRAKLSIGKPVLEELTRKAAGAAIFLCVVTKRSAGSKYVLHEIESRRQLGKQILPVLGPGATPDTISKLKDIAGLRCDDPNQLGQLVDEIARTLGRERESHQDMTRAIDAALKVTAVEEPRRGARWLLWLLALGALSSGALYLRSSLPAVAKPRPVAPGGPSQPLAMAVPVPAKPTAPSPLPPQPSAPEPRTAAEFRRAIGIGARATPEVDRVSAIPPGAYAFVHARQFPNLEDATVMREPTAEAYEIERTPSGALQVLIFVSQKERVALGLGPGVTVDGKPAPDALRNVLVAVPFNRIKRAIGAGDWGGPYVHLVLGPIPSGDAR